MSISSANEKRRRPWWAVLVPRPSPTASPASRAASIAIQFPALLVGFVLATAVLIVTPLFAALLGAVHLVTGRRDPPHFS
ncbi:MAG: hypothetical protein KF861_03840 [Planctomycetaceae bacterium]|nr:hypothetical protein [Planctomycetaceae bacterium]